MGWAGLDEDLFWRFGGAADLQPLVCKSCSSSTHIVYCKCSSCIVINWNTFDCMEGQQT